MNDFGDLLGTPYAPVSKIAPVKECNFVGQVKLREVLCRASLD